MSIVIYIGRISRCVEGKFVGRFKIRRSKILIGKKIFVRIKKEIWRR